MSDPLTSRPYIGHAEYGIPKTLEGALPWSHAVERLEKAQNYWIGTIGPDGSPHNRPTWGVWLGDTLYFGGGPNTRWSRNLEAHAKVSVHLESGTDVVILEGSVQRITDVDDARVTRIDDVYEVKYKMRHGPPFWVLRPERVLAWSQFPTDATRWSFAEK